MGRYSHAMLDRDVASVVNQSVWILFRFLITQLFNDKPAGVGVSARSPSGWSLNGETLPS